MLLVFERPVSFWAFAKVLAGFPVAPAVGFAGFVLNYLLSHCISVVAVSVLFGNATAASD